MKQHLFWILEVLAWLLILIMISSLVMIGKYNYRKNFNTYQIFMPDVDGMIEGSPVKLMGIQVGYVNQINIVNEDVYINFIITEPNVKLPYGSIATVEFSGLGGSKSLELYPPKTKLQHSGSFIIVQNPKRIHDSLGLLSDMFNQAMEITYTVSNFMTKTGMIKQESNHSDANALSSADNFLNLSNNWIDKMQDQCNNLSNKIKGKKGEKNGKSYEETK